MTSNFHVQEPYVLASLPRSLGQASGSQYHIGDVHSQPPNSRKRKRPELIVGTDGESANIYDISSSRLITSYPIPPNSSFTCPPCSIRCRNTTSKDVTRYTYISAQDPSRKIVLFKDLLKASGTTNSTTVSRSLGLSERIVSISATSSFNASSDGTKRRATGPDLIAVGEDGGISCLDGETLEEKWYTAPDNVVQDSMTPNGALRVQLAQTSPVTDAIKGLRLEKDLFSSLFSQEIRVDGFNPDVLVLITSTSSEQGVRRYLHVLTISSSTPSQDSVGQRMAQIHVAPLPLREDANDTAPLYRLDIPSGSLFELLGENIYSYNLAGSIPKIEGKISIPGVQSFLRLSKSSILASTANSSSLSFDVYNPIYHSVQATTIVEIPEASRNARSDEGGRRYCSFVAYFPRLEVAVAVVDTNLVAVQLEPPKARSKKRRADGLLIDSIGRGISNYLSAQEGPPEMDQGSVFLSYIPGSLSKEYWSQYVADSENADKLVAANDVAGFELVMAEKLCIQVEKRKIATNGVHGNGEPDPANGIEGHETELPEWIWPESSAKYPQVDRRWIMFAMSRTFMWTGESQTSEGGPWLICRLPESNVVTYLVDSGHLSTSNLRSALKERVRDVDEIDQLLGEQLPDLLADIDPTMELLLAWLYATKLGTVELLTAIRLLMRSLELFQDPAKIAPKLLTFPWTNSQETGENGETADTGEFRMELDRLEQELQITEYYLGDERGTRARALSVAFGKLGGCPAASTIQYLRRMFKPEETLSLIFTLRMEMIKDGWSTRYLDTSRLDEDDELESPPDGSIRLIADLMCRCIDSVGPGGWLINDTVIASGASEHLDSADLLASLRLEISAALEGVQEAVYLRGVVGEAVRYISGMAKYLEKKPSAAEQVREAARAQPVTLRAQEAGSKMLPLGLKTPIGPRRHEDISHTKVVSGGEVVKRSKREFGHLTSKKIGAYTLERIVI